MRAKSYAGYRLTARRPASSAAVEHWWAEGPDGPAEVYLGPEMLVRRARALPVWGPFSDILTGREGLRSYVVVRGKLDRSVDDLRTLLSPGACVAFAWHLAAALAEIHERGGAHGALHPGWTGVDSEGRLTVRPALTATVRSDPDGDASAQATDSIQLASILEALDLERLDDPALTLLLRGVGRDRARLRLQPGRAVRQSLSYLLHRHPDWEASLVEVLGLDWSTSLLPRSAAPLPAPRADHPWAEHGAHIPRVGSASAASGSAATVDVRSAAAAVPVESRTPPGPPARVVAPASVVAAATVPVGASGLVERAPEVQVSRPSPAAAAPVSRPEVRVQVRRATVDPTDVPPPAVPPEPDPPTDAPAPAAPPAGVAVSVEAPPTDDPTDVPPEERPAPPTPELDAAASLPSGPATLEASPAETPPLALGTEGPAGQVDDPATEPPADAPPTSVGTPLRAAEAMADPHRPAVVADPPTDDPLEAPAPDTSATVDPAVVESDTDVRAMSPALAGLLADASPPEPPPRLPAPPAGLSVPSVLPEEVGDDPDSAEEVFEDDEKTAVTSVPEPVRQAIARLDAERYRPETTPPPAVAPTATPVAPSRPLPAPVELDDSSGESPRWAGLKGVTGDASRDGELGSGKWEEEARPLDELRKEMGATPVRPMEDIDPSRGSWPMLLVAVVALAALVALWFATQGSV